MKWLLPLAALLVLVTGLAQAQTLKKHPRTFGVGPNPSAIAVADLNDDNVLDIVTADTGTLSERRDARPANDEASILFGQETLGYVRQQPNLKTGFAPYALALVNVDGLKWPDIVVANFHAVRDNDITLHRNLQNDFYEEVTFRVPDELLEYHRMRDGNNVPLYTVPGLTDLEVFDFDGDGYRDLIAAGWSSDVLVYFKGHPATYFEAPVLIPAPGAPRDIALGDFDRDGKMDVAATLYADGMCAVWRGAGNGTFTYQGAFGTGGHLPHKLRAADFDGDGRLDLAISHRHTEDSVVIAFGDASLEFTLRQEILLAPDRAVLEFEIADLVTADFNGDNRPDLAVAGRAARQVVLLLNQGVGEGRRLGFAFERYRYEDGQPRALAAGDLDGDTQPDLAIALGEADSVALLVSGGKRVEPMRERSAPPPPPAGPATAAPSAPAPRLDETDPEVLLEPLTPAQ